MSIPERFFRIAKSKLSSTASEIRERIDRWDDERITGSGGDAKSGRSQSEAHQELLDSLNGDSDTRQAPIAPRRTPQEIAQGTTTARTTVNSQHAPPVAQPAVPATPDPLAYHYHLLGVQTGDDFTAVQAAYSRLYARSEPSRFPAGSEEERQATEIQTRLEASYKILREAIDPTSRRFDMLEFDEAKPSN